MTASSLVELERATLGGLRDYCASQVEPSRDCCDSCSRTWAARRDILSALLSEGAGSPRAPKRFPVGHGNDCSCEKCMEVWEGAAPEPENPRADEPSFPYPTPEELARDDEIAALGGYTGGHVSNLRTDQAPSPYDHADDGDEDEPEVAAPSSLPEVQQYNEAAGRAKGARGRFMRGEALTGFDCSTLTWSMDKADAMRDALLARTEDGDAKLATTRANYVQSLRTANRDIEELQREVASLQRQVSEAKALPTDAADAIGGLLKLARLVGHVDRVYPDRYQCDGQVLIHPDQIRECADAVHHGDAVLARLKAPSTPLGGSSENKT